MMHRATDFDSRQARTSFGFTLVELLVVIGIIGMLVALLLPAVMSAQEQARQTQCAKQMKDLAGANLAHAMKKGRFPGWQEEVGGDHHSWVVRIMPYLDMQEQSRLGIYKHDPIFYCPSNPPEVTGDTNLALSYRANVGSGSDGVFVDLGSGSSANPVGLEDIRDGKRNTLLLAESAIHLSNSSVPGWGPDSSARTNTDLGFLYESSNSTGATNLNKVDNNTSGAASSFHQEGFNVAYCDGHTDFFYFPTVLESNGATSEDEERYKTYKYSMTRGNAAAETN